MDDIFNQALESGAWPEQRIAYLRENMPKFQQVLKDNGLAREYAVKDAMIAATHLLIAAQSMGLGTSIMNGWIEDQVKQVIGISDQPDLAIAVLVSVGYAEEVPGDPGRLPVERRFFSENLSTPYTQQ